MPIIRTYHGNLFDATTQCKVNTVNIVGVMGKGIALQFKGLYPDMFKSYKKCCNKGLFQIGVPQLWEEAPNDWVLNFPTKLHWRNPSKIEYLEEGLQYFVDTYKDLGITSITFPQLGCGNGGLDWKVVQPLMEEYLNQVDINVEIVLY